MCVCGGVSVQINSRHCKVKCVWCCEWRSRLWSFWRKNRWGLTLYWNAAGTLQIHSHCWEGNAHTSIKKSIDTLTRLRGSRQTYPSCRHTTIIILGRLNVLAAHCRTLQTLTKIYTTNPLQIFRMPVIVHRQVSEGLWKTPEDYSSCSDVDFTKSCDLDILTSPSLTSLPDFTGTLTGTTGLSGSLTTNSASIGTILHLCHWLTWGPKGQG